MTERRDDDLCEQTLRRLQEIVDGECEPCAETEELLGHLEGCARCDAEREEFERLKQAVLRVSRDQTADLVDRLSPVVRRLLDTGADPDR